MYNINRSALVPYSDQKMFDLVNDVKDYKNFLPWCGGAEVIEENDDTKVASVTIAFKGIHKTFTTSNTLSRPAEIRIALVDGPFSRLEGIWTFKALDENACKLSLDLDFDFSNRVVGAVIGPVFRIIADSMIDSFCKRAEEIYGAPK
jgi:ribosome-associated toxin RatA of RatAB toxin-antitoxin module